MNWGENIKKRWQVIVAVFAALAVVATALVVVNLTKPQNEGAQTPAPATSTSAATVSASPPAVTSDPGLIADCQPLGEGFVPTRFTLEQPVADEEVLSLGRDEEGNIAAPPGNMPRTASWWNEGPTAGSTQGKIVLSIHTYRRGGALGNELYANDQPLIDVGDVIKLYGANGEVACYSFAESMKVKVAEYDVDSDIMVDYEGRPRLLIIICADQAPGQEAASRIFFYADPIALAA